MRGLGGGGVMISCSCLLSFWGGWMILHDPELRRVVRLVADSSPRSIN